MFLLSWFVVVVVVVVVVIIIIINYFIFLTLLLELYYYSECHQYRELIRYLLPRLLVRCMGCPEREG